MRRSKVQELGSQRQGIVLLGDPTNPEPIYTSISFPGGQVTVTRTSDGTYWVHVGVEDDGQLLDARVDNRKHHGGDLNDELLSKLARYREVRLAGVYSTAAIERAREIADAFDALLTDPDTHHLAVRVGRK